MPSALQGSGGHAEHCKGSYVIHYVNEHSQNEYECSICKKTLILEHHWYGDKLKERIRVFSGDIVKKTGHYILKGHNKECDKMLPAERSLVMTKGSIAHKLIMCGHDVIWELYD